MINSRYKIIDKIGEGRCKVFLASDKLYPGENFAIKLLQYPFSDEEEKVFKKEFLLLEKINYPNIIKVNEYESVLEIDNEQDEYGITAGSKFFVMEYFDGKNLLEYENYITEETLRIIISQVCHTLYYLHQSNYIYGDLKPENILLSLNNGNPQIKFIDFGFAKRNYPENGFHIQGSAEYIAPEILRKEQYDHRSDLYSLGITLYRLIYKKFPFKTGTEVDIFKAHLEKEFIYPKTQFAGEIILLIEKLLNKDPGDRFSNSLEILKYIKADVEDQYKKFFIPVGYLSGREEIINKIMDFLEAEDTSNLLIIKGTDGSGKTLIADYLYESVTDVFYLDIEYSGNVIDFWKNHLRKFILHCGTGVFEAEFLKELLSITRPEISVSLEQLKQILIKLSRHLKFNFLIDDYNKLDELNLEFLRQLIPVFFSNNIKTILIENSTLPSVASYPINANEIYLPAFDEPELDIYLKNNFAGFFPVDKFKDLLILSSDFNPGSVINFVKEAIEFNVLDYNSAGPFINTEQNEVELLKSSQEEIISLKIDKLGNNKTKILEILSAFNVNIDVNILITLLGTNNNISKNVQKLVTGNFISISKTSGQIHFTSAIIKRSIYKRISSKENFHLSLAKQITNYLPDFKKAELARQYELGKDYEEAFKIYMSEISEAHRMSAFSYIKSQLEHLLTLPLEEDKLIDAELKLSKVLMILGDNAKALEMTGFLLNNFSDKNIRNELLVQKGRCLIALGNISEGISQLTDIIPYLENGMKQNLMLDIAGAYIDLSNFEKAEEICSEVISNRNASVEEQANAYSLNALVEIYKNRNLDNAIINYGKALSNFQKLKNIHRMARMELNLGNIYNMRGDTNVAQKYWNDSLQKNLSVGNLEQEAKLLINFGINYYNKLDFELALKNYKRAKNIFLSLGDPYGEGLAMFNQGECYLAICEYQNASNSLLKAQSVFQVLKNYEAEADALFLLAELYYKVNCLSKLELTFKQLQELIETKVSIEKHKNNLSYIKQMISVLKGNFEELENNIEKIKNKYIELDEKPNYISFVFFLCDVLVEHNSFATAVNLLNESEILSEITVNKFYKAQREFYLGKIALKSQEFNLNVPIEYFESASRLLENESINEFLYRALFETALYYFGRGNYKRAENGIFYSKNLIVFIAEKFTDVELKQCYLNSSLISYILNKLKQMEDKLH